MSSGPTNRRQSFGHSGPSRLWTVNEYEPMSKGNNHQAAFLLVRSRAELISTERELHNVHSLACFFIE